MAEADIIHFNSIPWTNKLLSQPNTKTFTIAARLPAEPDGSFMSQDLLVRHALNTASTMPHALGFYTVPSPPSSSSSSNPTQDSSSSPNFPIPSSTILFVLGPSMRGHNGIAHGGFLSTLIDEGMGNLMVINREYISRNKQHLDVLDWENNAMLTAGINTRFVKPMPVPNTVAVVSRLARIEGRKVVFDVQIRGEGENEIYVKAEGLWLSVPKAQLAKRGRL